VEQASESEKRVLYLSNIMKHPDAEVSGVEMMKAIVKHLLEHEGASKTRLDCFAGNEFLKTSMDVEVASNTLETNLRKSISCLCSNF